MDRFRWLFVRVAWIAKSLKIIRITWSRLQLHIEQNPFWIRCLWTRTNGYRKPTPFYFSQYKNIFPWKKNWINEINIFYLFSYQNNKKPRIFTSHFTCFPFHQSYKFIIIQKSKLNRSKLYTETGFIYVFCTTNKSSSHL